MTPEQAAARLGVAPHQVVDITDDVVSLVGGQVWLVTPEVARPYVPEVDGERTGEVAAGPNEEVADLEDEERTTEPAPKPARAARARGGKSST